MDNRPWIILRMAKPNFRENDHEGCPLLSLSLPLLPKFCVYFQNYPCSSPSRPPNNLHKHAQLYKLCWGREKRNFWKLRAPKLELMFLFEMRDQLEVTIVVFRQKIQQTIKKTIFWSYISSSIKDECKLTSLQKC